MSDSTSNGDISKHILPTSATMVGVSITVVSLVRLVEVHAGVATIIDDVAAIAAVLFLVSVFLSFLSLRSSTGTAWQERYAAWVFLSGLLLLVLCGVMLAWELGQTPIRRGVGQLGGHGAVEGRSAAQTQPSGQRVGEAGERDDARPHASQLGR